MMNRSIIISIISLFLSLSLSFGQTPILDKQGRATGLINMNPDPFGEPWIAGGLTEEDQAYFASLPELVLPRRNSTRSRSLPSKVDNTQYEQFRPVFNQVGGSCAQASSIGYVFTYEIDFMRGVSAQEEENQYAYGYTYNFLNRGSASNGSSCPQGWNLAEATGIPNVVDFGSLSGGTSSNSTKWMSGYDKYYHAMCNRGPSQFKISLVPDSGMQKMKEWLYDHGNGSSQGGCLAFGAKVSGWNMVDLPDDSPEAGFPVITEMGTSGGHAMSIGGYNDDIFYDINRNGTIEDNERGGVLMINSWGTRSGQDGKSYIMYDVIRRSSTGGIDRAEMVGVNAVDEYPVDLTYKISITHDTRSSIRIRAGISNSLTATTPSDRISFDRAFNYSGGDFPMGGDGFDPTIEIGLDVSALLDDMSGNEAKFFLQIESRGGTGQVNSFSLIDYRGGTPQEVPCDQQNVTITPGTSNNEEITYLSIIYNVTTPVVLHQKIPAQFDMHYNNACLYFQVPENRDNSVIGITLYSLQGKIVKQLEYNSCKAGYHSINLQKYLLPAGQYLCRMEAEGFNKTIQFSLIK